MGNNLISSPFKFTNFKMEPKMLLGNYNLQCKP
jgi:hypothetical protein